MTTLIRLMRDPDPKPGPSLADLDNPNYKPAGGVQGGTGDKTPADLEAERQKAEAEKKAAEEAAAKAAAEKKTPEEQAAERLAALKAKPADQLTAEEKAELEAAEAGAGDEGDEEGSFWDDVDKLRGNKVEIDWTKYKDDEGNPIDPQSPQGALIREEHIVKSALQSWENDLKAADPRGYAYLLHRQAGGSDDDFFAKKTPTLPEYETFKASVDLQKALYKQHLTDKGLDSEIVDAQVEKAIKDGKIFDKADAVYKDVQKSQEKELADIEAANQKAAKEYTDSVNKLNTQLTTKVAEGKGLKIVVPEADKQPFLQFIREKVQYHNDEKKFSAVLELDGEDTDRILEALYLLYKKGDLSTLIKKETQKANVKRLTRAVEKSKTTPAPTQTDPGGAKVVPLGML